MYFKKIVKLMKKDEGSGLILALMTLMVLSILGASLGAITIGSHKLGDVNRDDNSTYYIAEAGANMAYDEFKTMVNATYNDSLTETSFFESIEFKIQNDIEPTIYRRYHFEKQFGELPEATVTIVKSGIGTTREYLIKSAGTIGQRTRILEKNVTVTWIPKSSTGPGYGALPNSTTIAKETMTIQNNVEFVEGTVYLDSKKADSLDIHTSFNNEGSGNLKVYIPKGADNNIIMKNDNTNVTLEEREQDFDWTVYKELLGKFPIFPENPIYTELSPTSGTDDTISENINTITINTNDKNISIVVDGLILEKNIIIEGDGRVDIYVKNNLEIKGKVEVNNNKDKTDQLQIFYKAEENQKVIFGNDSIFNGTLFSNLANLDIGNNVEFTGLFITGGVLVNMGSGDFNSLIIAPNADITLSNSNTNNAITGITVGKHITLPTNANLKFSEHYLKDFPLRLPDPESDGDGDGSGGGTTEGELIITEPGIEN